MKTPLDHAIRIWWDLLDLLRWPKPPLWRKRDDASAIGDHADALIHNNRIRDIKEGKSSDTGR